MREVPKEWPALCRVLDDVPGRDTGGADRTHVPREVRLTVTASPVTVFALGCELQAEGKLPSGNAMFDPFTNELPEYGVMIQSLWNR
jgi:hypothetical protein